MFFEKSFFAQILLESLPISSSGHLRLMGLQAPWWIDFCAHGPTVIMLLIYTAPSWWFWVKTAPQTWRTSGRFVLLLALAECSTALFFGIKLIGWWPFELPLAASFWITALMLLSLSLKPSVTRTSLSLRELLILGVTQGLTCFFGYSRMVSTIVVGRWTGLSAKMAFLYSIALQIPLFGAGALLGCWKCFTQSDMSMSVTVGTLIGLLVACMGVAYLLLWVVQWLFESDNFWLFSLYLGVMAFLLTFFPVS